MLGFAYTVSDYWRSTSSPTYEAVRSARPLVVNNLRAFHESTKMFLSATGGRETKCVVYAAINKVNNKIYVGMTTMGLSRRKTGHFVAASQNRKSLFCSAIKKYGKDGFEWIIIGMCRDSAHAKMMEQNAIASIMPEYNMTAGGEGSCGGERKLKKWQPSPAEIKDILDARKPSMMPLRVDKGGRPKSEDTKKKMAVARKKWWEAKHNDEEFMKRYRETTKRSGLIGGMQRARGVVCVTDNNRIFESVNSTARFYGISIATVARSCKRMGAYKRKMKHRFVYLDTVQ